MKILSIIAIYIITPCLSAYLLTRYNIFKKTGSVILAYIIGIIMSLSGLTTFETPEDTEKIYQIQQWLMNISVPLAIPLMLFSCDFKLWTKSLPKTLVTLIGGVISVVIAVVTAFFIFRNAGIDEVHKVAGLMTGMYTGGTLNFAALGNALDVNPNIITFIFTFETLVTFPMIMFIVGGGYKFFRKLLPFKDTSTLTAIDVEINDVENYKGLINPQTFPKTLIGLLLSIIILAIGAGISLLTTGTLNDMVVILVITTLSIIASFFKPIRELPKTFELGMIFILLFSTVVASQFNIRSFNLSALSILFFIMYVMVASITIHLIISRFCKVSGDLFTVAHVALICSPPFIPPIVGAIGNKKVLISGIIIGLIGYAIGTYLGISISYILGLL